MYASHRDCSPALIFSLALLLTACSGNPSKKGRSRDNQAKVYANITLRPITATINTDFPATIQGQQNIEIRPKIDGYMQDMYVDEGSEVKKGQLLFRISAPQYEQNVRTAEANIKIAEADVNAAQMEVNKVKPLVDQDIISPYGLESARYTLEAKKAALAQAKANLVNARVNLSYTTIYSPADGVIGAVPFKIGSLVSSTTAQPLTTVSNITKIYAYFSINEKESLNFFAHAKGNTVQEKLKTLPPVKLLLPNGATFAQSGDIETIGGLVNQQTGSVTLRATFSNPGGLLRSGNSAIVRMPYTRDSALLIPQSATYQVQGKLFVYVIDHSVHDTLKAKSVPVSVNAGTSGNNYVVEDGLKTGDQVLVEGTISLRDGMPVKTRSVSADSVYRQ
ncbi:efflux RND transporter periplasmic adaptor subunit [Chitinophaga sp. HK235]|uniref:efflux RND transporter periplasmic adaptor subunit n=1 Tax=Chitinophaga sp. HK235 TaxID=2952571 RepID=UPI001BA4C924|nr:efflux RND transporter periplasmic adaptor subunit [Chitinophaga sp. HK235]